MVCERQAEAIGTSADKNGLAGVESDLSPEFTARRARWATEQPLVGESAVWAFDRAIAATLRIERCERAIERVTTEFAHRAKLAWELDQAFEVAKVLAKLKHDPVLASRQLQTTLAGVSLLIEAWLMLASVLEGGKDWSEAECSKALDLLGVSIEGRSARTLIDSPEPSDSVAFRLNLALVEVDRLEALRDEVMIPLDEMARSNAMLGDGALMSKPVKLLLGYERDAWKRYRESMKAVKAAAEAVPPPVPIIPPPVAPRPPKPREQAPRVPDQSIEEERRELLAIGAPFLKAVSDQLVVEGFMDEDAWLDELERRVEALPVRRMPLAPERTQFGTAPVARGS